MSWDLESTHLSHASHPPCIQYGATALYRAVSYDSRLQMVELLLEHKATIEIENQVILYNINLGFYIKIIKLFSNFSIYNLFKYFL